MTNPDWRDAWGNTFDRVVRFCLTGIILAEQDGEAWKYDQDHFPEDVVNAAVEKLRLSRGRELTFKPVAA